MENPKSVHRFLLTLLGIASAGVLGFSIYLRDFQIFLGWLVSVALLFVVCGGLAFFNVVVFAPVLMLLGRLTERRAGSRNQSFHEHVD